MANLLGQLPEDEAAVTAENIRYLFPDVWSQVLQQKEGYVLLRLDGTEMVFVRHYERSELSVESVSSLELGQVLVEVPSEDVGEDPSIYAISGETNWLIRNLLEQFGPSDSVIRDDGLVLVPDYSQLEVGGDDPEFRRIKRKPR